MKILITITAILLNFSTWASDTSMDDAISEKLAPLLSNYLNDYEVKINGKYVVSISEDDSKITTSPIFLIPPRLITAEDLQDCDENSSSLVCVSSNKIRDYIKSNGLSRGKIIFDIDIFQKTKPVKRILDLEVYSL